MLKERTLRLIVTFHTTAEAMATQNLCRKRNLEGRLIPAPRALTADCGIAWSAPPAMKDALLRALEEEGVEIAGHDELLL